MKYIVEVNAKYLVSVEATSCLDAEHQMLDYTGVWGALAFDQKMTKTDTFLGAVQGCEMVSMNEFARMVGDLMDAKLEAVQASEMVKAVDERIEELKKEAERIASQIRLSQQKKEEMVNRSIGARGKYEAQLEKLGKQRN